MESPSTTSFSKVLPTVEKQAFEEEWNHGPCGKVLDAERKIDVLKVYSGDLIKSIVFFTNVEGNQVHRDKWKVTDDVEISALFGMWATMAANLDSDLPIKYIWQQARPLFSRPFYSEVMSRNRSEMLMRCIRTDYAYARRVKNERIIARNSCISQ